MDDVKFLKLSLGSNIVRAVTNPYQYLSHTSAKGRKNCTAIFGVCSECPTNRPRQRWLLGVINRADEQYNILDIGQSVFAKLREFARDENLGNPNLYDIEITVNEDIFQRFETKALEKSPIIIGEDDKAALQTRLLRMVDPMYMQLKRITSNEEFKNYYATIYQNNDTVGLLVSAVEKWFPQYQETLKTLIVFS